MTLLVAAAGVAYGALLAGAAWPFFAVSAVLAMLAVPMIVRDW